MFTKNKSKLLCSRSGLGVLNRRLPGLSILCSFLGARVIVELVNPRSIRHLFSAQTHQPPDGLASTRNILDVHLVKVYRLSWVLQPSLEGLEAKVEPIGLGRVSNHRDKGKLMEVVDGFGFGLLQLKAHFLIFALKMMILLLRNHFALLRPDHRGLARLRPLEDLEMLLLELP